MLLFVLFCLIFLENEKTWIGLVGSYCSDDLVDDEFQVHLILIGHTGVGKTSLRKHLKNEPIDINECPTIVMEPEFLYRESVDLEAGNPFKTLKDALKSMGGKVFLTMWDTGGQPVFQDLLPCFARLKCMYGIVFRLPDLKHFESKPDIRPFKVNCESVDSPFTNKDIFYRNLAFVQAYSCSMQGRFDSLPPQAMSTEEHPTTVVQFPAAVVIGTYKDMATDLELNESTTDEVTKSLNRGITDFVDNNNVSVYPAVPGITPSYIHEVDNTASGKKLDMGIDYLRDNISRCARESNTKVQKSWKKFEVVLKRLPYTTHVNLGVLPVGKAIAIANELNVENPMSALMYFHEVGVFMWYHMSQQQSLKEFLVIDPKTLLEVLSKVFCLDPELVPPEVVDLIQRGLITDDLFGSLLKEKASNIDDSWFIAFLEEHHLSTKIIHPDRGTCYFLPSVLSIEPTYGNSLNQPTYGTSLNQSTYDDSLNQPTYGNSLNQPTYENSLNQPNYEDSLNQPSLNQPTYGDSLSQPSLNQPTYGDSLSQPSLNQPTYDDSLSQPSLNQPTYEDSLSHQLSSNVSPLFIVPKSGYIPTGMFTRLLTALAGVTYGSTVWRIPFNDCFLPRVCRNQFEFVVNESLHVILSEFSKYIWIDTALDKNAVVDDDLYFNVASTLDVQLQRVVPRWIENKEFALTFLCSSEACLPRSPHFVSGKDVIFESNKFVTCSIGSKFQLHRSQEIWLKAHSHRGMSVYLCIYTVAEG